MSNIFTTIFNWFRTSSPYAGWTVDFTRVPAEVSILTAAIDTLSRDGSTFRRITVVGWDADRRPHEVGKFEVHGEPGNSDADGLIDVYLRGFHRRPNGTRIGIDATVVDIGGHWAEENLAFCHDRRLSNVWAVKARCDTSAQSVWPAKASRTIRRGHVFYRVGIRLAQEVLGIPNRLLPGQSPSAVPYAYAALCGLRLTVPGAKA